MAWALRAGTYANDNTGFSGVNVNATTTVTLGAAVSAGDCLVLGAIVIDTGNTTAPTISVTDSVNAAGNWAESKFQTSASGTNGGRHTIWTCPNSGAGTPVITVKIVTSTNATFGGLCCAAFSGLATSSVVDGSATAGGSGTSSTAASSGNAAAATTAANELCVGVYTDYGFGTTLTKGNVFGAASVLTGVHQLDGGNWQSLMEHGDTGASGTTGSPAATATSSAAADWGMVAVVLKLSGAGPPQDTPELRGHFGLRSESQMRQLLAQ